MTRTEFGNSRTTCACVDCRDKCQHMPGMLIPADLARLIPAHADPLLWAEANLRASPGAIVSSNGRLFRIPTMVPAVKVDGSCIHLKSDLCAIHHAAPFGCAFFDCGSAAVGLAEQGLIAVNGALHDEDSLYHKIWMHLATHGYVQSPPELLRRRMIHG